MADMETSTKKYADQMLKVNTCVIPNINLALQQNAFPVITGLEVDNAGEKEFSGIELTVTSSPEFLIERTWPIEKIAAGDSLVIKDRHVELKADYLRSITEALQGELRFTLKQGDTIIDESVHSVQLLAKDEWGGVGVLPEVVAAFVQPNDTAVQGILRDASKRLEAGNLPAGLDGYQSKSPKRTAVLASAIWSAVCQLDLTYSVPPASFETNGQKVRLPSTILETRMATCMDTTLLFAACLEQAGLNSLILFTEGHAFVGVWLNDEDFSSSVIDDAQAIRKRIQLKEIVVFETTLSTNKPPAPFTLAIQEAVKHLENDDEFHLAVDIKRARLSSIKPLSDKDLAGSYKGEVEVADVQIGMDIPDDIPEQSYSSVPAPKVELTSPEARVENWKRQLLDLTMRNRLLNTTARSRAIVLECYDLGMMEDLLAEGQKFKVTSADTLKIDSDPRSEQIHLQQQQEDLRQTRVNALLSKKELVAKHDQKKLDRDLLELYRQARLAIQEGGTNILYIAAGFLNWQQPGHSERTYKAPLILIPVELTRRSVNSGFQLRLHEDEPRFNPTLLQMLKQDFALEIAELAGELPTDDSGLDVHRIWEIVRREIRDIPGWEVEETALISTFSFSKYLMWMDLCERVDHLKTSPMVKHLIESPRDNYTGGVDTAFPEIESLDTQLHPKDTYVPMLADSSQMAAICAAEAGKDFVLIGPPGTGKSQTITNMISQLLAVGKTVLFVSEKTAALEVVYRRLNQVGLGEHCLELHSSKARKLEVINQLGRAWEAGNVSCTDWEKEASRLAAVRDDLNQYVTQLHHRYPNGLNCHQAIGVIVRDSDTPVVKLEWPSPTHHNVEAFEQLHSIAKRIDVNAAELSGISGNPLAEIEVGEWSPSFQSNVMGLAGRLKTEVGALEQALEKYLGNAKIALSVTDYSQLIALSQLASELPKAFGENYHFGFSSQGSTLRKELPELVDLIGEYHTVFSSTTDSFTPEVLELPLDEMKEQWQLSLGKWFLPKFIDQLKIKKSLKPHVKGNKIGDSIVDDIDKLIAASDVKKRIDQYAHVGTAIGRHWNGVDSNTDWITQACTWLNTVLSAIANMASDIDDSLAIKNRINTLLEQQNELLEPNGTLDASAKAFDHCLVTYKASLDELSTTIANNDAGIFKADHDSSYADTVKSVCNRWIGEEKKLHAWCAWRKVRQEAVQVGLMPLIDAIETGVCSEFSSEELLLVNYCRWWVNAVIDNDEILRGFIPAEHREKIVEFQQMDTQFMALTQQYVRAKLAAGIPAQSSVPKKSEWGVLARELQKKTRHMPLRQLIANMPETLTQLTPCLMMSPMSIAQYLPPDSKAFDVVIFDEASQITVCDAIGAIARAKQSIVVGDPKQLPPTSFFGKAADNESNADEGFEEDLESILDECLAANIPKMKLNWHYRSRCESLITFSNHRYYDGTLITFPNTNTEGMSVHWHRVDSVYKEGKNRINKGEAEAIVADVVAKLRQPEFKQSIGVVTFNQEQQEFISNLFEQARSQYPEIEPHFSEDNFESVFVKNLESVQGDERDIIYFSITFGKDAAGKLSMNFGPMNKAGGTRRLNVAITRAKEEMRIFSSLKPEQIDLSRTASEGIRDLKHFLEYAQRGASALTEAASAPGGFFDSPFEQAVAERLQAKGWITHSQVGVSGFRIDLGVVNPDAPGSYLAAVECDGATYHRSATARDRDSLREGVLRGLGWEVLRIWSTDWWVDSHTAVERIDSCLNNLLSDYRAKAQHAPDESMAVLEDA
ncbi:ATP-dependent RecD-like DNA helicase [BD1-7 clade bacterium]|uniref:ATP-dependent RecD-like DNA helicase n=1 Tax=BD1-7 clade bacterium TaxID=2029982 RepID=A0A5S9NYH2_9GAMM|nr:ATP-dependent RecD-like DNA helicase [BD1-7 clade bacterium]